jgi:hypothetical protein
LVQTLLLGVWGESLREVRKSIGSFYDASYSTASSGDSSEIGAIVAVTGDQELMIYAVAAEEIAARTMHIFDWSSVSA